jgi:hypothetical protein
MENLLTRYLENADISIMLLLSYLVSGILYVVIDIIAPLIFRAAVLLFKTTAGSLFTLFFINTYPNGNKNNFSAESYQ